MATAVKEEQAESTPREVCSGSGLATAGMRAVAKSGGKYKTAKYECPQCGRRVGTYKRRSGELKGKSTLERHYTPRPRAARAIANGE